MRYTIGQVAEKMGLTAHTLRYYDKEGLLPFVQKASSGQRVFSEQDLEWLVIIECLKGTGLQLKEIKQYIDWCREGDSTLQQRLNMFKEQKKKVEKQIAQMQSHLAKVNFKIAYYEEAVKNGSLNLYERNKCLAAEKERLFRDLLETGDKK